MKQIKLAKTAGFCFGVNRAIDIVYDLANKDIPCCTLGPIIHNKEIVNELKEKNIDSIDNLDESSGRTVVIRSHGVSKDIFDTMDEKRIKYIDATCPFVSKIHKIVYKESQNGSVILIAGDKNHPEVKGIMGHSFKVCYTFKNEDELQDILTLIPYSKNDKICVISQTTFDESMWEKCCIILKNHYTNLEIFDTICNATSLRQKEANDLSKECDAMIVIGDKNSSNTQKLYDICKRNCINTFKIETSNDLNLKDIKDFDTIGVTAGASTPDRIIKEVLDKCQK